MEKSIGLEKIFFIYVYVGDAIHGLIELIRSMKLLKQVIESVSRYEYKFLFRKKQGTAFSLLNNSIIETIRFDSIPGDGNIYTLRK